MCVDILHKRIKLYFYIYIYIVYKFLIKYK